MRRALYLFRVSPFIFNGFDLCVMVNKKILSQHRGNLIKTIFTAPKTLTRAFVSVSFFKKFVTATLLILISYYGISPASTIAGNNKKFAPQRETIAVFPSQISSSDWKNVSALGNQDLYEYSLLQDFNESNSAYLDFSESEIQNQTTESENAGEVIDPALDSTNATSDSSSATEEVLTDIPSNVTTEETVPEVESEVQLETGTNEEPKVIPEPESTVVPESPISYLKPATGLFLLAQAEIIEAINLPLEEVVPTSESEPTIEPQSEIIPETQVETIETIETIETDETDESESEILVDTNSSRHTITLEGFDIPKLESGHFVDNLQLRLSLAGEYESDLLTAASVSVDYSFGEFAKSAGTILLEEEVSNAINGGYYLITLPSITDSALLNDLKINITFEGDIEKLNSLFIDSAWLELGTVVYNKQLLEERTSMDKLVHLKGLEEMSFLSDELDFTREENPFFNLRYNSQRNFLVRGLRGLFGNQFAKVDYVTFVHNQYGPIEVAPDISITSDGLVNIVLSDSDKVDLKPGIYKVEISIDEGGYISTDSFEFQWGLLSINTNQTEYTNGDVVKVSMGALSSNGNTVCDANLNLFVTSPSGYISNIPVIESGQCDGNNVIDVPDYSTEFTIEEFGEYELYLERTDEFGEIIAHTYQIFTVVPNQEIVIERNGPTRIFPPSPYAMTLTVHAFSKSFSGEVIERVPNNFLIKNTDAEIRPGNDFTELVWNIDVLNGGSKTVSYEFDAPDISPFLFELGPAKLVAEVAPLNQTEIVPVEVVNEVTPEASSTEPTLVPVEQIILEASSTEPILPLVETELITPVSSQVVVFEESRKWQIASDATGSMLLMWDGASIPTGWTCVSCTGGDVFYQRYIVGSSTAGINGGAATHTHTVPAATVNTTLAAGVSNAAGGGTDAATLLHTHTLATPSIGTANNLPLYRNLVIIQHNSAGEPLSIPTGAIAIFDATVPTGWTQYSAQDGYYVRGESTANIGVTGGSNTHTHAVTGTLSGPTGTTNASNGPTAVATQAHTHTISTTTASDSSEPPYIEAILGKLNATTTLPNDVITMWTDTAPTDWNAVSTTSEPFENRFLKPAATYGTTGGASSHTPANVNGIVSSGPNATNNRQTAGTSDAPGGHTHTVNVTGFSSTTHLPSYRSVIFAKRAGGSPPAAPTIYTLFDNEKTGTSSPKLEFSAEDTVGTDSMIYQVQWDDDYDIATSPSGDRTSDIETGCSPNCFENLTTPADTNPFNETERVRFTIQDTLTDGVTYYWRVRAIKETGSTWGTWSDIRSFTYVADTDPSQWMQTTDDQFDQGVFSNTETYGSSSVRIIQDIPTEALVAYGEGVITTPRYRIWSGTAWSAEADALDIGGVPQWVRVVPGTTRDEYILGVHDANNDINMQVFDGVSDTWGDLQEVTATANDTTRRAFDVTYETNSGDAIVVYCSGTDAAYRTWNGATWSAATTITTASTNNCHYISMASDPTSDEIVMVARDTSAGATDYEAFVWSGSAWGNAVTLGSITTTNNEGMSIQYEESGGQAMVVTANGAGNNFLWMTWNGTEWSTPTTQAVGNDFQWGILKADVGSDKLALCYIDLDTDIGVVRWDGEAWSAFQEFETAGYTSAGRNTSCEFETTSGRDGNIMIPYSDTTNSRYTFWNGTVLSAEASISTITEAWEIGTTRTGDGKILSYFHDSVNTNYDFSYWDGTAWSAVQTLETSASVTANPRRQPVGITAKIFQPSEGTLTSDPVDFDLVSNRTEWGEALWSTTEPIGSEVKIQVLYATSTNNYCDTLIPNGDLAGNSAGFGATSTPLDLSGLSTTTYNNLCLRATISTTNSSIPTLDDWTISWERQPYLVQSAYRWYVNANSEDPSDVWPQGATDLALNESIPIDYSPGSGDVLRLRMAVRSDNATLSASTQAFKLQYAETSGSCTSTTAWIDVGSQSSSTAKWRGYGNLFAFDGSDISTLLLGSDVGGSYEEENDSAVNPNAINVGNEGEWDWVLQHNSATDGVQYCFRMVLDDGTPLDDYEQSPALLTNASPVAPTLEKLFDNEQVASTTPWFEFVTTDTENDGVSYQVQVDNNYDFSSVALDRNSISNVSEFENIVNLADKDPFTSGQNIQFKPSSALSNNTTYYWRVRAKDVDGSNDWGDWSAVSSFTVNTGTTVTTWYQTEQEQFATNDFNNTEATASDDVILTTGFTVGTTTGTSIDYDAKTNGNAWGELSWTDNETLGTVTYRIEYLNAESWELVPDSYLPGNSSGFNASPVSLLGLDPQVHNLIRVRANLVNTTGTPRLLDWKVEWGFAVEQPTLVDLFDNEKTSTTTPTFTFNTTDPDSDSVQYEISWSTDNTFVSGSTTPLSGVSSGFANVTNGGDTSPFNSGDTISYTIQSGDALTNNQTYWWRVRARDPLGGNAWSVWSEARSFTVDTTVTVSTWFQTTDEQFDTSDLTNTETTGSDSVEITSIIREAFTAYAEGTVQTPRYRLWNGSTWSTEASGVSVGGTIRFVESAASSFRDEYMIATQDSTGRVRAQVYDGVNQTTGDLTTVVTAVPSTLRQGFDVAYESDSGDALVVACEGTEATYKVWDGSSWSASTAITLAVTANCNWIRLASDPVSDEIILVVRDATTGATDYEAQVWNGSAWGNSMTMGSMSEVGDEGIAVEYEESGDRAVVVVSNGLAASFAWNSWNGSAWSGAATQAYQDDFENGRLVRDLGSDNMVLCGIDQDTQMHISRWTGSSNTWNAYTTVELTGNAKTGRPMDCVFETTTGRDGYIMIPYSDTTNGRSQFWDGSVLSGEASISTIQDSFEVRSTRTGDGTILSAFYDDINTQYDYSYWNGTAWSTHETLESTAITTTNPPTIPLDIVAREYPTFTEGTVVSDPIVFSEGSGLKWQQAGFTDTTPGASTILYQVEYYNGSTWALIPDAALAGNAAGFNATSIDLSAVSRVIYNTIRLKANLACVGGDCPTLSDWKLEWSAGINVAGTLKQYDQVASTTSGTIAVAINGVLQSGKTATVSNGAWSIPNVTAFEGDIVTVFVSGAADSAEAVSVTRYDGDGDIAGFTMFERHLALGSNDATSTPLTNADVGMFDYTNTEDIFFNVNGTTLSVCSDTGCGESELYIKSGVYYTPAGLIVTNDFENNGIFTAGTYTHEVNGSWDNNATTTMTGSTILFAATSTTETIDNTGAVAGGFNNVTFGTTTGNGTWNLSSTLDVNGALTVTRGTLARGSTEITVAGNVLTEANGFWTGTGTTTFDGSTAATWRNQNATIQNIGRVVVDGTSKAVTLASNVAAESITIGANDTLDASVSNYDITVYDSWINQNNFVARSGEVLFAAGSSGKTITTAGDAFYDLSFTGVGGGYSFTEATLLVNNNVSIATGTVTMPTGTTTIAGSFNATGGTFAHNNGVLAFTAGTAKTITFAGGAFTNTAYNLFFNGAGSWTITDTNATSSNDVTVRLGTLNFPSGTMAIGGSLADTGGTYAGGTGKVLFYSSVAEVLTAGGSSFNDVEFSGTGSWSFSDTTAAASGDLIVTQGTLTLPTGTFTLGGSYTNNATVVPGTGTVLFNSSDSGETINFGSSSLYDVNFNSATGGWTITAPATTTHNLSLTSLSSWTLNSGQTLSVGGTFTNSVGGASTTWTGSTLNLSSGTTYSINNKSNLGDVYNILEVGTSTDIKMWNSSSTAYVINASGSLYSQDHNAVDGDLYIFGAYERTSGTEYWSYATDFDGTALGGSPRQVDVRFASGASATFVSSSLQLVGTVGNITAINGQSSSDYYGIVLSNSTINAEHYIFSQLNSSGLVLNNGTIIDSLENGEFNLSAIGGTSITLSTTTIDANPALQIYNVAFNTTLGTNPGGNGEDTFEFFDDFADGSINTGKWTKDIELGAISETSGYLRAGGGITSGNYGHTSLGSEVGYSGFLDNAVIWRARNATDGIGEMVFRGDYGTNRGYKGRFDARTGTNGQGILEVPYSGWTFSNGTGTCTSDSDEPVANTWYTYQITASSSNYKFYRDSVLKRDCTDTTTLVSGEIALQNHYGSYTDFDWVAVRKFVNPEPTHSTWGSEEEPTSGVYRKSHIIAGTTAGTQTDYVLPVTVNFGAGTDSAQTMYCGGNCNGDFSDVQFTDASGIPLDFWREESYVASTSATFWVKLSSIPASPGTTSMYLYYGNATGFNVTVPGVAEAVSYVWFRNHSGNLDGEANDNDTGDPGSVRWDDSSLTITISGRVYSDAGVTPLIGGTCNGSAPVVKVVVNGGSSYTGSCSNIDGTFSISGVVITGDPTLTIYLDGASGGEKATVITRTPTANITNLDIYANRVIVRNEDVAATTIENLAVYDSADDADLQFTAATSTNPDTLTVMANSELFVFASSTFAPGGEVTLQANATANSYDGTLYLDDNATFTGSGTSTYSIGGRLVLDSNAVFSAASSTVLMTATTTGKSITASAPITFNDLVFNGIGGGWNLGANIVINGDMTITNGTVTGTGNISLETGSLTGDGILSLGAGTTTIKTSNTLGGNSAWTFYNLTLGNASQVGTTTPVFTATTTVAGKLTIQTAHYLAAGSTKWDLSGTGTVFVETGTFVEGASTVRYSGAGANVLSTQYYNLDINSGAGSQTYTATGLGIIVDNDLTIGGAAGSILNLNTNDPLFDVNGDLTIHSNGTLSASNSGTLTIAGNYDNNGVFTGNGGTITFNGSVTSDIAAGSSSFSSVLINSTGDITISEPATTTATFNLLNANSFTLNSGQTLAVSGNFYNNLGGAATVWTGSTLNLSGGNNYSINTSTTSDSYATIDIDGTTQIRMWNSDASAYNVESTASLYSQDQAGVSGDLYIWGDYRKTAGTDYWSYDTDFDGTSLSGSERKVDVYFNSGSSATISGGAIYMIGTSSASTTVQNQGAGTYGLLVGGNALASFSNYEIRDINSSGLVFSGTPTIVNISRGDLEVSQTGGSAITVGGTVITQNPAKTFTDNRFALNGAASGFNVTATGTTLSSWRFTNYTGDISGEGFDVDPDGDPGYIVWDDSAANITISGTVYSDDGSTTMGAAVCDSSRNAVRIVVAGLTTYNTSCATGTGIYSISGISFSPGDSVIAYILPASTEVGATVTVDPGSNINNFDIYQNRVIVRHEGVDPISIADLAVWDSSDDANIPFTAVNAGTDTLTLPANRKLIVWTGKEFEPTGNVTISGGGVGAAYDGTLELFTNAIWTGQGTESLAVGGSMLLGSGATFTSSNGTTTFTTTGASRTIDVNESAFGNISFTGSGSWSITDPTATFNGNFSMTNGSLTMPTGTSTFNGSLVKTGGSFAINGSQSVFTGASSKVITLGSSDLAAVKFSGGNYSFTEVNATTTGDFIINSGTITLPSGNLVVGGNFRNISGAITHNTSEIILTNPTAATVLASSSDLYGVTFTGGGNYSFEDTNLSLLDRLLIQSGNVTLASGTLSIGGSFDASGGTFANASGTLLFNSGDSGEYIDAGINNFYNVVISSPAGGYTLMTNATTTNNFSLSSASSFTAQSGVTLAVNGVFQNLVGGSNTTWTGSTLYLNGNNSYEVNTKVSGGDQYNNLTVGPNSDISFWNSAATTTSTDLTSSVYSQDNAGVNGALFIYGDYHISTTTEYWSYATDFDGTSLSGSERAVTVQIAANATTTVDGGSLQIIGTSGNRTTLTNQGSGTYALNVSAGTINALYYTIRNMNSNGLNLTGSPTVASLSYGNYELAVASGSLISLASSALNANASLVITGNNFSTTTAISGYNVNLTGSTSNAWTFTAHSGNLDGEDFDIDGGDACGSIRWSDSACLLTQQTQYRWRNDDGGLGVPDSEWYDTNWLARKRVKVDNQDSTTYTDAAVKLLVTYDSDMQADFDDLHFTDSDGVTSIPHWFGSTTDSAIAEVWVKVPSLPADDTATLFMYYSNPTATSSASSTATFIVADDFEDGNITEYSGQTTLFTAGTSFNYNLSYGLDNAGNETGRANTGGIYRLDQTVSQGETFRYLQYIDTAGTSDETCTKFGIQGSNVPNDNYAICVELPGTDHISLVRNAIDNEVSASLTLASSTISLTTGWYEFEVDWGTDDSLFVSVFNSAGSLAASMSASDSNYTTGGFGFTYWFNQGGWDAVSSRPTLTTEPTIIFGAEQVDGGATWKGVQNTPVSYGIDDIARLRVVVENSGLNIINQQFLLEYAPIGAAPSCEAVSPASFVTVPIQASCGTSPICMQSTTYFTNNDATVDLLFDTAGTFVAGEAIENPSDKTNNLNINQDYYTEIEYAITPTANTVDESLCFRVTNDGTDLDTYLKVAQMDLRFDPVVTGISLNDGLDISLIPGTTTAIYATGTVTDLNGFADIVLASSTIYRSGVSGGAACAPNNNDCYISTSPSKCEFTNCSGNSCTVECRADIYFHADPTDLNSLYEGDHWAAFIEVEDASAGYGFSSTPLPGVEINTLRAIDVQGAIDYGALAVNTDTGSFNASTTVLNQGNVNINIEILGTDLTDGASSTIPAEQQKFATSTFTYSGCTTCDVLSSSTPVLIDVDLAKPTIDTPPVTDDVYWGIRIPISGINSVAHQGINVFTPVSP